MKTYKAAGPYQRRVILIVCFDTIVTVVTINEEEIYLSAL